MKIQSKRELIKNGIDHWLHSFMYQLIPSHPNTIHALSLALHVNMAVPAVEALFQYQVVRANHFAGKLGTSMALEGIFIAYLYSIFIFLYTVVICIFFKSCKTGCCIEQEGRYSCRIEFAEDSDGYVRLRTAEELGINYIVKTNRIVGFVS